MRIGFISDAHGNHFGLQGCLEQLKKEGAEEIYFLGDAVGYWPHGPAVIEALMRSRTLCVKGNHDAMILGLLPIDAKKNEIYRLDVKNPSLSPEMRAEMAENWPVRRETVVGGRKLLLLHGRPSNPLEGYLYEDGEILESEADGFDVVAMGHTHRPFIRREKGKIWINAGSCGLPRDVGNMASCAIFDTGTGAGEILRVEMDVGKILGSCPAGSVAPQVIDCLNRRG